MSMAFTSGLQVGMLVLAASRGDTGWAVFFGIMAALCGICAMAEAFGVPKRPTA